MNDWRREPGTGRYAQPERERRFLVVGPPASEGPPRMIEDRYLLGTNLRLRRMVVDGDVVYKLTQKVRRDGLDPSEIGLTTMYVNSDEYEMLRSLPAHALSKTRRIAIVKGVRFAVDEFAGDLAGVRLAEVEVDELDTEVPYPPWLGTEVTTDDRYTGGRLAGLVGPPAAAFLAGPR